MRTITFTAPPTPVTVDTRTYSATQLGIGRTLIGWMQSTYVPVGGLGDLVVAVSEKLGPYNPNTAALPQSYGALARIYTDLKYDAARTIVRASNSHIVWSVMVNVPTFAQQAFGGEALEQAVDLSRHPVIKRYPSYFQRNSVNGNRKFVILTKDNRLPYVAITKGEYLHVIENAVARLYATEKTKIDGDANPKSREYFMMSLDDKQARRLATLANNQEKYQDRLSEPAKIFTMQPDAMLENIPDVFEGSGGSALSLQVYTIDPRSVAGAKTEMPQWVVVSWTAHLTDPVSTHLHEAVIGTFNFQYLHDYFFEPEKVKGQPYAPLK